MRFLILGGSGQTGQIIIDEALAKGHHVTALVRTASSLPPRANLTVVEGTPLREADLERAFASGGGGRPDAVLVALAARRTSQSPFSPPSADTPPRLMADSVGNAIRVMKKHRKDDDDDDDEIKNNDNKEQKGNKNGNKHPAGRIVIMSAHGTGSSMGSLNFAVRCLFQHSNMRHQQADHDAVDAETRDAAADGSVGFVLVRPSMLVEGEPPKSSGGGGERPELRVWPDDGHGVGLLPRTSRAAVARFMVRAAETDEFVGTSPVVTN